MPSRRKIVLVRKVAILSMTNRKNIYQKKHELQEFAERIRDNLDEFPQPLLIEFTGTPKAGKSTCVESVSKFLRRNRIPTYVMTERASMCPISDKHHVFFNIWTGCNTLSHMLSALERRDAVIILDRGLFDTLVWMDMHKKKDRISDTDFNSIVKFLLMDLWVRKISFVVSLSVEPKVALQREFKDQITDLNGSVMNLEILQEYNNSQNECLHRYKDSFRILHLDTTDKDPVDGVAEIAFEVLKTADDLVDEEIAVVERRTVSQAMNGTGVLIDHKQINDFTRSLIDKMHWLRRTEAEDNPNLVQIVPVLSMIRNGEILVANIRGKKQGRLIDKNGVWVGGHLRRSDLPPRKHKATILRRCVLRELYEELGIRLDLVQIPITPKIVVWDYGAHKSNQHLGIIFEYQVGRGLKHEQLHLREIWESKNKSLFTQYMKLDDNLLKVPNMESWSQVYLKQVHNIMFEADDQQTSLFQ